MESLDTLFQNHVVEIKTKTWSIIENSPYDHLVLSSGEDHYYFHDDKAAPFETNGHFGHWCPAKGPGHMLVITPGHQTKLFYFFPHDFWLEFHPVGDDPWTKHFDVTSFAELSEPWKALKNYKNVAFVGSEEAKAGSCGFTANPSDILNSLNWNRRYKTNYEIACIEEATKIAAQGHLQAAKLFHAGASELEIYYGYISATQSVPAETAFEPIAALDEKSAILHYTSRRLERGTHQVLLMDAGSRFRHYCSDITRTHLAPTVHKVFRDLTDGVNALKNKLCDSLRPGIEWEEINKNALMGVGALLIETGVLKIPSAEEAFEEGLCDIFLPHGVGHLLGVQLHDVGGKLVAPEGTQCSSERYPFLRFTNVLEPRTVITVEPGLYFNPILLEKLADIDKRVDWKLIEELKPLGGIRLEDDMVITKDGAINLTKPHLA